MNKFISPWEKVVERVSPNPFDDSWNSSNLSEEVEQGDIKGTEPAFFIDQNHIYGSNGSTRSFVAIDLISGIIYRFK